MHIIKHSTQTKSERDIAMTNYTYIAENKINYNLEDRTGQKL